jgi:hypothetical protein
VDHVVKLKFLLAMHSAQNGTSTVALLSRALEVSKGQVRDMANELIDERLLRRADDELELTLNIEERMALANLASLYTRDRGAVLQLLQALGRGAEI